MIAVKRLICRIFGHAPMIVLPAKPVWWHPDLKCPRCGYVHKTDYNWLE